MHGHQQPLSLATAFHGYTNESGSGSRLAYCDPYIRFLTGFIAQSDFSSILDLGCGDLAVMDEVLLRVAAMGAAPPSYLGVDCLPVRLERNRHEHPRLPCALADVREWPQHLGADLVIVKDVLQHWDSDSIRAWLDHGIPRSRAVLIVNCARGENVNAEIVLGDWRPLDLLAWPFCMGDCAEDGARPELVFQWDTKDVVLLR